LERITWKKYSLEFLSIFIAVISAFALNNWNENRRNKNAGEKILYELEQGLIKDINDINLNIKGHEYGLKSCQFWRKIIEGEKVDIDSLQKKYIILTRDFTSLQNSSAYDALKAKGLELIENDSLRTKLISLFEYDYSSLKKLEEEYEEMQYQKSYFKEINAILAPYFIFNNEGELVNITTPLKLDESDKNILKSYLMKIEFNRKMVLKFYKKTQKNIEALQKEIKK